MMDWQCPQVLYLVLPLCVGWFALAFYSQKRRENARARFVDASMGDRMLPPMSQSRFWGKLVLQEVAIVMGLLALAQPQFGQQVEQVVPRGSDLYVMIDVSRSMLATDVPPSRLERAKADVLSLVNQLDGERIGLIAFAGQAVVKCPLTVDYDSFRRSLIELDPNSAPRGGTAIGDAIRKSLEVFQANAQRDQAILLITDGDDQQSYPLEAAAAAAERKVAIFSVGLGDTTTGARIPQRSSQGKEIAGTFVEYEGQQVWSKLDGSLLQELALKTSGVYVPAGTKTYDLGELYKEHLQGRRGDESESQTRVRKSERFQVFLLMSLLALVADLSLSRYRVAFNASTVRKVALACCLSLVACMASPAMAKDEVKKGGETNKNDEVKKVDPQRKVAEGLKHFADQQFAEAQSAFALASEKLQAEKSKQASIAAFDEACALHRKGDFDAAKERYLQAGLSQDRTLSTSSHFNLAMMASEQARVLAGDNPETVPTEKRTEILDKLKQSIGSYRHCLEIDPKHAPSRKNLEIVRQWIKFYSDRWAELDRQKRRNETNLMQFLDYIIASETAIQVMVKSTTESSSADSIAEIKRLQDELLQEIPVLREKIATELQPPQQQAPAPQQSQVQSATDEDKDQIQKAIQLLQSWADESGSQMEQASASLQGSNAKAAIPKQDAALEALDRIWNAIVDFRSLLSKELESQTKLVNDLESMVSPATQAETSSEQVEAPEQVEALEQVNETDLSQEAREQQKILMKAMLLAPKAEAELQQMENQSAVEAPPETAVLETAMPETTEPETTEPETTEPEADANDTKANDAPAKVDPEEIKKGLRLAVELAPKAVEQMESSMQELKKKNRNEAKGFAEEARRILKEIADAQPKDPNQKKDQDQNQQDQQDKKNDQENQDENKNDQQDSKDQDKKSEQDKNDKDKDKNEKDQQDKEKDKNQNDKSGKQPKPNEVSQDRLEEALRKVKEREQEKRERDRELKARILGRSPVEKDW
jgi:Ca-activated chloride channel family protein